MGATREGEIIQVQGGHIIRATGRKDRHSKVYTAKGPRDRRVRLSAHTAIQFYDVQDRLGYDRPSKAVDWLMKKAKSAIDQLDELPPFDPGADAADNVESGPVDLVNGEQSESSRYEIRQFQQEPTPEMMKPFFPSTSTGNHMGFHGYPHQDLCLSLQSFQNTGLLHGESDPGNPNSNHALFSVGFEAGASSAGGGGGSWPPAPESNLAEMGQLSRLLAWNGGGGVVGYGGAGERGSLLSSFHPPPSIRAWDDLPMGPTSSDQHRINPKVEMHQHQQQASMAGVGVLGSDGFIGFCVPSQQMHGGTAQDAHAINLAYHQNSASSMSTDSSR